MANALTVDDVKRLLDDPSSENRFNTAQKIAHGYSDGLLSDDERQIAEDIFSVMVHDAELRVREALSANLKSCPFLSHDIARALAEDVETVALPVLQFSEVLTDEDLIDIVRTHGPSKQIAVAKRTKVSENVSDALVDAGDEQVVTTLVANDGARIAEPSLQKVLDGFGDNEALSDLMAKRASLPVRVTERLVSLVTDTMRAHIIENHELEPDQVSDLVLQTREKATLGILSDKSDDLAVRELVVQLFRAGRLTPTIMLRALCMGDMRFFEAAVAVLSKVPLTNVRVLLHDEGDLGLGSILRKAGIPQQLHPVIGIAIEVSHETDYDGEENDRERFRRRMIERILTQVENPGMDMDASNIDYLLTKISQPTPLLAQA
jgi:uncharacterized protein (DUF2336 family)